MVEFGDLLLKITTGSFLALVLQTKRPPFSEAFLMKY
jgi:hypothetical protein